jgi:signal transduction histidine kinase
VGIAERVKIYGGELSAGPSPTGGFTVRASLPLRGDDP